MNYRAMQEQSNAAPGGAAIAEKRSLPEEMSAAVRLILHLAKRRRASISPTLAEQKRLAAWIHACGHALAEKLHGAAVCELTPHAGTEEFTESPEWETHQRLEVNPRLDGASRALYFAARGDVDAVRLQKSWATRLLLNQRGAHARVEVAYMLQAGRGLYEGQLDEEALKAALVGVQLDNACAGMRRVQWSGESMGRRGKQDQRSLCAVLWARLRQEGAFETALAQLIESVPLWTVLKGMAVHSSFLGMLIARGLIVLLPALVAQSDVDACTVVGDGAAATLVKYTDGRADGAYNQQGKWVYSAACKKTFDERLARLHADLLVLLDPALLRLVTPQGWTLDLTEGACCELRRWDSARSHRARGSAEERVARQRQRLVELQATWEMLGFAQPPRLIAVQPVEEPATLATSLPAAAITTPAEGSAASAKTATLALPADGATGDAEGDVPADGACASGARGAKPHAARGGSVALRSAAPPCAPTTWEEMQETSALVRARAAHADIKRRVYPLVVESRESATPGVSLLVKDRSSRTLEALPAARGLFLRARGPRKVVGGKVRAWPAVGYGVKTCPQSWRDILELGFCGDRFFFGPDLGEIYEEYLCEPGAVVTSEEEMVEASICVEASLMWTLAGDALPRSSPAWRRLRALVACDYHPDKWEAFASAFKSVGSDARTQDGDGLLGCVKKIFQWMREREDPRGPRPAAPTDPIFR